MELAHGKDEHPNIYQLFNEKKPTNKNIQARFLIQKQYFLKFNSGNKGLIYTEEEDEMKNGGKTEWSKALCYPELRTLKENGGTI